MTKEGIVYLTYGRVLDSLNFIVIEHSGIAPSTFVEHLLEDYDLGVLFIGIDAPSLLTTEQAERIARGFNEQGIRATAMGNLIWFEHEEALELFKLEEFDCQGDALILKNTPPEEELVIPYLPKRLSAKKDKLALRDARLLNSLLRENELYMHDDFSDCLIVTKDERIFSLILDKVRDKKEG